MIPHTGITSYSTLGGTYNIQYALDSSGNPLPGYQTGYITLVPPGKPPFPITLAVSLSSIQNLGTSSAPNNVATQGHFVEFDDTTGIGANVTANSSGIRAQGSMALQSASVLNTAASATPTSPFTGSYAYGMAGYSAVADTTVTCYGVHTCGPISLAGSMIFDTAGTGKITSGIEDVTVAENNGSAIALSGTVANSGNTDASGRTTASIMAAATSNMPDWPSNFAIYAVDPQHFYFMSIDPYTTNSLIGGRAQQQNLADIASNPFSSTQPLLLYGNVTSTTSFSTKGPNGQIRVEVMLLQPAPSSPTAGKMSGSQWVNASGTYTANGGQPGAIGAFSYTVSPTTGRVTTSTTARTLSLSGRHKSGFRHAILNSEQYSGRSLRVPAADRHHSQPRLLQLLRLQRNIAGRPDGNGNPADTHGWRARRWIYSDHPIRHRLHRLRYSRECL